MSWVATAVLAGSAVVGAVGGAIEADAKKGQARDIRDAANKEAEAYEKAQEMLQKSKDEEITDLEASHLKAEGLITDLEEALITSLNQTDAGAIETLKQYTEQSNLIYANTQELLVQEAINSGALEREAVEKGAIDAIATTNVFSDKSIEELRAYGESLKAKGGFSREQITQSSVQAIESIAEKNESAREALNTFKQEIIDKGIASREAIESGSSESISTIIAGNTEAISGLELLKKELADKGIASREAIDSSAKSELKEISGASEEAIAALTPFQLSGQRGLERVQFFSGLLTDRERTAHLEKFGGVQASPLFNFRLQEREKQLERRQKATGRVLSGKGLEEFREEVDRLTAEESERQLGKAQSLSAQGQRASEQIAGLKIREGELKAKIHANKGILTVDQLQRESDKLVNIQGQIAGLESKKSTEVAGLQQQRGQLIANQLQSELGLSGEATAKLAALEEREGMSVAEILRTKGVNAAANMMQQAGLEGNLANNIAVIENQRGASISGIQLRKGTQLAQQRQGESAQKTSIIDRFQTATAANIFGLGKNLSSLSLNVNQARQAIRQNSALNRANLATGLGAGVANIGEGKTAQQVSLLANQARQQFAAGTAIAGLEAGAKTSPFVGALEGVSTGLGLLNPTKGGVS
jgi:hypothetical protein